MISKGGGRNSLLQKAFAISLATVSGLITWGISEFVRNLVSHVEALDRAMTAYILKNSTEITALEEYEKLQDERLKEVQMQLDKASEEAGKPVRKHK
jgi:hypothetical protein